jgi:hypothetical protein
MRKIFLPIFIASSLVSFGKCDKKKCCRKKQPCGIQSDEVWLQYDETKCANPWQFNWFAPPTDEQLAGAVKGELTGRNIQILEMRTSRDKDMVSCDACTCPNGFHYFVRIKTAEKSKLTELNFYETTEIPGAADKINSK